MSLINRPLVLLAIVAIFSGVPVSWAADFSLASIVDDLHTIEAKIIVRPDGQLLLNKGTANSVHRGDLWSIHEQGEVVTDPESGAPLGSLDIVIATVKVVGTEKHFSEIIPAGEGSKQIRTGLLALRYDDIKTLFLDSDSGNYRLYEKLRLSLPDLQWQGYKKIDPQIVPNIPDDTLVIYAGKERLTIWCGGEIVKIYEKGRMVARVKPAAPIASVPLATKPPLIQPVAPPQRQSGVANKTSSTPVPGLMTPGMSSKIGGQDYRSAGSIDTIIYNLDMAEFDQSSTPWFVYLDKNGLYIQPVLGEGTSYLYRYEGFGEIVDISVGENGMIAMNIFNQSEWQMQSRLLRFADGRFEVVVSDINYILSYVDVNGDGSKELIGQSFDEEIFFGSGVYELSLRANSLSRIRTIHVGPAFRIFGAFWADLDNNQTMEIGFYNYGRYLQLNNCKKELWQTTDVFGGSISDVEIENIESEGATSRREIVWPQPAVIPYKKGCFVALAYNDPSLLNMISVRPRNGEIRILYKNNGHYFLRRLNAAFEGPVQAVFARGDELYCAIIEGNIFTGKGRTNVIAFSIEELKRTLEIE